METTQCCPVESLMTSSADQINAIVNDTTLFHQTLAQTDISRKDLATLKSLGVNFNVVDAFNSSIIVTAVQFKRSVHCLKALIRFGADPKLPNKFGFTPLHVAAATANLEAAIWLIFVGCDVNAKSATGVTPLHLVFETTASNGQMAHLLLAHGANINATNCEGCTPLEFAICQEQGPSDLFEILQMFQKCGADFNAVHTDGFSPLALAIFFRRSVLLLQKLVDLGAEWRHVNPRRGGESLLQFAATICNLEAVSWLLTLGADVNQTDLNGWSPLMACFQDPTKTGKACEMATLLLEHAANVNVRKSQERVKCLDKV